jgi:hypothetical protein
MRTSIVSDEATVAEVLSAASLVRERPTTIIRLAIRAGLPTVTNRFQAPRPEGHFKDAYRPRRDRLAFEDAMGGIWTGFDPLKSTKGKRRRRRHPISKPRAGSSS